MIPPGHRNCPIKNCLKREAEDFLKLECINEMLFMEYNVVVCILFFGTISPQKFSYGGEKWFFPLTGNENVNLRKGKFAKYYFNH